ncbi:MAG: DMT family transporter, partial [Anaerolineaceae bacterium]|nr:DMT family transporter [Anaerolineaceae bacterium]
FLVLLPGLWRQRAAVRALTPRQWGQLALLGVIFYALTQGGQFLTLNHLEAITFSLLLNFSALLVAVFGIFFLKETPTPIQWGGILLFLIGVLLYFLPLSVPAGEGIGLLFAALTVSANAAASLLGRSVNRQHGIPPLVVTAISMGIGSSIMLGGGLLLDPFPALNLTHWLVILILAVVNTALAFTLWNRTLRVLSAVESSIINNTMLIQITLLAWLFLGEGVTLRGGIGLALAAVGILLANLKPTRTRMNPPAKKEASS